MSGTVDDRVVGLKFDNGAFEKGAATSLSTLQKIKESLNMDNATAAASKSMGAISSMLGKVGITNPFARSTQGANELQSAAQQAATGGMNPLAAGIQGVSGKMVALGTVAITALANITNRAVNAGLAFAKSFTIAPVLDGLHEYETNLQSIQTIQANTDRPLKEIETSLAELNKYSDQTIYNFSEMAKNIGTFTAAGVDLQTATSAIKGIANIAALSGSTSEQAASAMYQLSQALASGKVGLQDWNSVVNAGMGGKKLQNALAQTAVAMDKLEPSDAVIDKFGKLKVQGGSFRESIMAKPGEQSWLTSDILEVTLASMDGRFSDAALAAEKTEQGLAKYTKRQREAMIVDARAALEKKNGVKYSKEQFEEIQRMSTMAFKSATEVKKLGQVFDIVKETIGSGWSASFASIFGNLKESKKLFTGMKDGLTSIISANALARNKLLAKWKDDGGRQKMIKGLKNSWEALLSIARPITEAFRAIFPATTAKQLVALSQGFKDFTKGLIIGDETAKNLKRTFKGVFAIFSIAGQIIGGAVSAIFDLIGSLTAGGGGFLEFTAGIGQWLQQLDKALKKGETFKELFQRIADVIKVPLAAIMGLGDALGGLFDGGNSSGAKSFADSIGAVSEKLTPLESFAIRVREAIGGLAGIFVSVGKKIGEALAGFGPAISGAFTAEGFQSIISLINTALLGGIVLMVRNFFNNVGDEMTGGFFQNVNDTLGSVTETLGIMQANVKANIILKIAGALALLAASIAVIAMLDPKKVLFAMGVLAGAFYGMQAALVALTVALGVIGAAKLPLIGAGLVLVATSLVIFAGALALMGAIPFDNIVRGLLGLGGALFILQKFIGSLDNKGIVRSAIAMALLGVSLNLMATALILFGSMSWESMAKGLTALSGTLIALAGAMRLMPKGMVAQAAALLILSVALNAMAAALIVFSTLSWEEMARGLTALAGSLVIIAGAMRLMPKDMLLQAIALNAVATAMTILAGAIKIMATMSWEEIGRGMVVLGGSMLILALGLKLMTGTLSGAAALVIATAALAVLVPVLISLGAMSWENIIKGLVGLAGIFVILGVAGLVLTPVIPMIAALSASMLLLGAGLALAGAGFALVGAGALAFAMAFGVVVGLGQAGVKLLTDIISNFISSIPSFMSAFAKGLGQFAQEISRHGPAYTAAISTILSSILDAIIKNVPKAGKAFLTMLRTMLNVIVNATPMIVNAGLNLIIKFLEGISSRIGRIVKLAIDIVVNFLDAVASRIDKVIQSGVNLIISFLEGIAKALNDPKNRERLISAVKDIGKAIIDGMISGIEGGIDLITDAAQRVARAALNAAKDVLGIKSPSREFKQIGIFVNEGFVQGLQGSEADVIAVMDEMGEKIRASAEASASEIENLTGNLKDLKKTRREAQDDKNKKNDDKFDKDIKKAKKALEAAKAEQELIKATKTAMQSPEYKKQAVDLRVLGQEYDRNTEQIKEYETELSNLTSQRDQIQSKFNESPDIEKNTSLASYNRNAAKQKAKVEEFNGDLQNLLSMGLDRDSYNKLLEEGLDAQPFIDKLIAAGPSAVDAFDQSNVGLEAAALDMGNNASKALNDVGVLAMEGLLAPLKSRQIEIEGQMTSIGEAMVIAIKKALKIKSPSRAFMEVGKYSNEGLANGLKAYSGGVKAAAAGVGTEALDTLQYSLRKVGEGLSPDLSMTPVIAPVLDLTQLQKEATKIEGMLPESSVVGQVSLDAASAVAEEAQAGSTTGVDGTTAGGDTINYTQNIHTQDRPSEIAIFRGTRNQLSMKKEELRQK